MSGGGKRLNETASSHAAMKALNNARLDNPPFIIAEEHKLHLERLALKTGATASMLSMQIHPAKPEVSKGPRLVTPPKEEDPAMAEAKTTPTTEQAEDAGPSVVPIGIDEVMAWAKTGHGGKQVALFQPVTGCARWGVCELPKKTEDS